MLDVWVERPGGLEEGACVCARAGGLLYAVGVLDLRTETYP